MAIGLIAAYFPYIFILYFYYVLYANFGNIQREARNGRMTLPSLLFTYLISFELLARITKSYPFVPSEYVKYITIALSAYLLILSPRKAEPIGWVMLGLLVPSLFFDMSGQRVWYDIVNNYLAPVGLSLGVALYGAYRPTPELVRKTFRMIWLPLASIVVCMFVKTPDLDNVDFQLKAMSATTGGASSNQASTMLGLGMFLSFYSLYMSEKFSGKKLLDGAFLLLFAYQGLLSFSRGGMVVGVLSIVLVILTSNPSENLNNYKRGKKKGFPLIYMVLGTIFLVAAYMIVDQATGGKLSQRYQGETEGTVGGYAEKDLSRMTSGRSGIVEGDLYIFSEYPILGGGAGSSAYLRAFLEDGMMIAPHIEFTRLLAEQGLLGLIYFIVMLYIGWKSWLARKFLHSGNLLFILYVIGLLTSFHSAMRTFVTPYLIALSSMGLGASMMSKKK